MLNLKHLKEASVEELIKYLLCIKFLHLLITNWFSDLIFAQ